jgi:hypothetical protein
MLVANPLCWFCHDTAHILILFLDKLSFKNSNTKKEKYFFNLTDLYSLDLNDTSIQARPACESVQSWLLHLRFKINLIVRSDSRFCPD